MHELPYISQTDLIKRGIKGNYVKIIEKNIKPGKKSQFAIKSRSYIFDFPYDGGSVMHYWNKAFGIKECQTIQITLSGGALAKLSSQKLEVGVFEKSDKVNGKLSWTKSSHAIWLATNEFWIVGLRADIGHKQGFLNGPGSGLPYGNTNDWSYWNGFDWVIGWPMSLRFMMIY